MVTEGRHGGESRFVVFAKLHCANGTLRGTVIKPEQKRLPWGQTCRKGAPVYEGFDDMLGWFQALMPKQGRFFEQFEAHSATLVAGSKALSGLLHGEGNIADGVADIVNHEHRADDITREVLQDVRRVFVTPFDRSAITGLIGVMDDAIDQMNATASAIQIYEVTAGQFAPAMREMSLLIVEAAEVTAQAIPLLRSLNANAATLHELTARLIQIEGRADNVHDAGLRALFKATGDAHPMEFIVGREIYNHLEKVTDRFEDVANEIQGLVIDHA